MVLDTHSVVEDLKGSGFTEQEANGVKNLALLLLNTNAKIFEESDSHVMKKVEFDLYSLKMSSDMELLKREFSVTAKEDFTKLTNENDKFKMDLQLLRQNLKEEVDKMKNSLSLSLNLEKSRSRDEYNEIRSEIIKTQNRIDTQVANLRTSFEQYRNDMLKYAVGTVVAVASLGLSIYRFWK